MKPGFSGTAGVGLINIHITGHIRQILHGATTFPGGNRIVVQPTESPVVKI